MTAVSALDAFFAPQRVALVGASERTGSVGHALMQNLCGFPGQLFPVNPRHPQILGRMAYAALADIDGPLDLVILAVPAPGIPALIRECCAKQVGAVVIISAGFRETGAEGLALEQEILSEARRHGLRIVGPNCLGIMAPHTGLNATFATAMARPGGVAFLSQSGALCTAILDWSLRDKVDFSAFVSVGSMLDVGWGDLIEHFGRDPHTTSIVIYMESVGDAARFMEAARQVALTKPIVVIKVGRTELAAKAAASHTGAMTGSDEVLDAAFRRAGVLRVETIEALFDMAEVLSKQPLPDGPKLAIVTNAGGPGALATDALISSGGELATLSDSTLSELDAVLPAHWSHGNPVDVLGDADVTRYGQAFAAVLKDGQVDGLLAVLTPQAMTDCTGCAQALIEVFKATHKPILTAWMGADAVEEAKAKLNLAGLPTFHYPDRAARAFRWMWQRQHRLSLLAESARISGDWQAPAFPEVHSIIGSVRAEGRRLLTEIEAKALLAAAGIPTVPTRLAEDESAAVELAQAMGFPVVLKLHSATITHKSDVGGVQLNLTDGAAVRQAWQHIRAAVPDADFAGVTVQPMVRMKGTELILGCSQDAQFGPVLLFGAGGTLVEVFQDKALELPPLSPLLANKWMQRTKIYRVLQGVRGEAPVDLAQLAESLVKFATLVSAVPDIAELDINPLIASSQGIVALDARVLLS